MQRWSPGLGPRRCRPLSGNGPRSCSRSLGAGVSGTARTLGVPRPTVIKWRNRFASDGVDGLADRPRSGRPKTIDDAQILAATLEPPPESLGVTHWSTRLLGKHLGIADATVARAWRAYRVQPAAGDGQVLHRSRARGQRLSDLLCVRPEPLVVGVSRGVGLRSGFSGRGVHLSSCRPCAISSQRG